MNRNFGIGVLIICFASSTGNAGWADEVMGVSPMMAQSYQGEALDQQLLDRDRQNRDEEIAIRGLIEDNDKLTQNTLAHQEDEGLQKIDQTMLNYRNALYDRDRARIESNGEAGASRYGASSGAREDLEAKDDLLAEKYEMLTDLKNEMIVLNDKLRGEGTDKYSQQEQTIAGYKRIARRQQYKIQILVARLNEMDQKISHFDKIIAEKDRIISRLRNYVDMAQYEIASKDDTIKQQATQIAMLQGHPDKDYSSPPSAVGSNESTPWLQQVLAATQNKAEYYKLTSQKDQIALRQAQEEVRNIKDDFARHFKDYDRFENDLVSLKAQAVQLTAQLSQKQQQLDSLTAQLENKITQDNNRSQEDTQIRQDQAGLIDRVRLAKQLIGLQQQETALLDEKNNLAAAQNAFFKQRAQDLENKIKGLLANHQILTADVQSRMDELKNELSQKQQQVDLLKSELENKITENKDQGVLTAQIQDLQAQLQDKENQMAAMRTQFQSGQETQAQADTLKQQLADQQSKVDLLKQELDAKNAQTDQMTSMISDYQKKLESKNSAYNDELRQVLLLSQNGQTQGGEQIADLSARLQEKEAQIVKLKKDLYDLQESTGAKDREAQAKDLSLSMVQQKTIDERINEYQDKINALKATGNGQAEEIKNLRIELAMARQQLAGMPSSDEIDFMRTGLKKVTVELKQKDELLLRIKANADEYEKEYKAQSRDFQSLKEQLQDAYDEISHKNEDLKYKKMEVIRLKERSAVREGDLQDQIKELTRELGISGKKFQGTTHAGKAEDLELQLMRANEQIKDLRTQLNQFILPSKNDPLKEKLKQALDKIDEQGRMINILAQKLQDAGLNANLTQKADK